MKKAIIALIVLILAAGGSVGAFLAVKNGKEKEKQQASKVLAENELFSFDPYSPTKIVFSKGDEVYEVEKQNDKWTLTSGEFAMDQDYCQLICTYFSDLTAETNYGEITDEKLEMYGLTDPDTIEVTEPEPLPAPTFAAHHAIYSELMRRHDRIRMREIPETEA